jgi:hypothetical protein
LARRRRAWRAGSASICGRGKKPSLPLERKTTSRIARRLLDAIRADYVVRVELLDDHVVYADGRTGTLDLANKGTRANLKRRLIADLCSRDLDTWNRD